MSKRLVVLFDANPLVSSQKSGVGYYTYRLIDALAANYPDVDFVGHYFNFLGRKHPQLPTHHNLRYKQSFLLPGKVLSLTRKLGFQLPFELLIKQRGDIALFPNFVSLPTILPVKKVVVVHDLCFEDYPQYLQPANQAFLHRFVPSSVKKSDLVIAVSQSTKNSIVKHYGADGNKILVTPIPPPPAETVSSSGSLDIPNDFILFMSTLEPRKNFINLVKAYTHLPNSLKAKYALVLAGGMGWHSGEAIAEIEKLQATGENIILTGYVSDQARAFLYKHAALLVMPSHYEGFGMPLLEAMSYGTPVAASDIPVFHEVAEGAAAYFNKDDIGDIAKVIERSLTDASLKQKLLQASEIQLKKYDWARVASTVMDSFHKIS